MESSKRQVNRRGSKDQGNNHQYYDDEGTAHNEKPYVKNTKSTYPKAAVEVGFTGDSETWFDGIIYKF